MRSILTVGQTYWVNKGEAGNRDTQVEKHRGNGKVE